MTHRGFAGLTLLLMILVGGPWAAAAGPQPEKLTLERLRALRREAAHRPRRVIFNNDGCDCLYFPEKLPVTAAEFLAQRTSPLAGSQVDAIFYCTISSGFSFFTHNTQAGTVLDRVPADYELGPQRNIARELIAQGTDCLQANINFARQQRLECFWSMRMNDTHDAAHRPDKPYFLFPPLKVQHPDWLVGEPVKRTPFGRWSSVDYGRAEVRELAFRYLEEVCRGYDVDGIELDFFRHLCYFKSVAQGGTATASEREAMTELVRRVRRMTEDVGCARGRPILLAIRVPDSREFNVDMGLDVERWLSEGLVDLFVTTCYFQLNPWKYTIDWARRHGVVVYAGLSESRVRDEERFLRNSIASYHGRALEAWRCGADGIYVFNYFHPRGPVFRELGDPQQLATMDKLYFVTVRDGKPTSYLAQGDRYQTMPLLTPMQPATITATRPLETTFRVGDDLSAVMAAGHKPRVTCHLRMPGLSEAGQVRATLNGQTLGAETCKAGWLDLVVPPKAVRMGENRLCVSLTPGNPAADNAWTICYEGDARPGRPWRRDRGSAQTVEELVDGALRIADRGEQPGDYLYYRYPWAADPAGTTVVEARAKVLSGSSYLIVTNGQAHERLGLWPDHIGLWDHKQIQYKMNTTDAFHVYRLVTKGRDLEVYVDGQRRLTAQGLFGPEKKQPGNEVAFGAANSGMVGDALWDYVRARSGTQACLDAVLRITFARGASGTTAPRGPKPAAKQ